MKKITINKLHLLLLFFIAVSTQLFAQENSNLTSSNSSINANDKELVLAKNYLSEILNQNRTLIRILVGNDDYTAVNNLGTPTEIVVDDTKIDFIYKDKKGKPINTLSIYFSYLLELNLKSYRLESRSTTGNSIIESHLKIGNVSLIMSWDYNYTIKQILNNLVLIQSKLNEKRFNMEQFNNLAANYRSLKEKPKITEEQRKYIIQANTFTQLMNYDRAMSLYQNVLAINQVTYPEAYLNLALLSAQTNRMYSAINYMEKYLLLKSDDYNGVDEKEKIKDWKYKLEN